MKQIQALLQQYFDDTSAASLARVFMQHAGTRRMTSLHPRNVANHDPGNLSLPLVRTILA
jgi:hypothetical protein